MKNLLIGYGNSLRRDDGIGPFLAGHFKNGAELDVVICHQLTPELAERVSRAGRVVFADANTGVPPGEIVIQRVAPRTSTLVHCLDAGGLLGLCLEVYGRAPEAIIVGIGGESFDIGEGLSPAVVRAGQEALKAIRKLLHSPATDYQADEEQHQEDDEENLRNSRGRGGNSAEAENSCQDGNH